MRLFISLILLSLVACPGSDLRSASSKGRRIIQIPIGKRKRPIKLAANQENPQQTHEQNSFIFPVQVTGEDVEIEIFTAGDNTRLIIQTIPEIQSINILAGFDGQFSSENPRKITLINSSRELTFQLGEDASLTHPTDTTVTKGQVLGSTTGSVTLTLKENGTLVHFCLNELEEQIQIRRCDTP